MKTVVIILVQASLDDILRALLPEKDLPVPVLADKVAGYGDRGARESTTICPIEGTTSCGGQNHLSSCEESRLAGCSESALTYNAAQPEAQAVDNKFRRSGSNAPPTQTSSEKEKARKRRWREKNADKLAEDERKRRAKKK